MRSRFTHRRLLACATLLLGASTPRLANGQRVLGVGDDATVLPRGAVRVAASGTWSTYNELYGPGGKLESMGAPLSTDSLGAKQLELLRPIQTSLRTLAQQPTANVSLGPARTDFTVRIARSALVLDLGLTSRIMLSARLPYEHTISEVVFTVNPRDELTNRANIGLNPALDGATVAAINNRGVVDSLLRAATTLTQRLGACSGSSADPVCSDQARVQTLINDTKVMATGIAKTYGIGADTARGAAFVPLAASTLQTAIAARVSALNASLKSYIPDLAAFTAPTPAQAPISAGGAAALLSDSLRIAPLGLVERSHIGDVELGAKILLFDSFGGLARSRTHRAGIGVRIAVGGLARLGTGQAERPDDILDIGTGDGQTDIEGNGAADIVIGRRFWASVVARYGVQMADERRVRIPAVARDPFLGAYREQTVSRNLGDYLELQATPRYVYNDYLSASLNWTYRRKGQDTYTGTFSVNGPQNTPVALDASILGADTQQSEQRIGGGASFSTLRAYDRGRARVPLELQVVHWQNVSGSGYVPKQFSTQIQVRYYTRLFGAPLRPRPTPTTTPARD